MLLLLLSLHIMLIGQYCSRNTDCKVFRQASAVITQITLSVKLCLCRSFFTYLFLFILSLASQVFQTFACEDLDEIGKSFLRADFRIECNTSEHKAYKAYAEIMICVCEYGLCVFTCALFLENFARCWRQVHQYLLVLSPTPPFSCKWSIFCVRVTSY